MYVNRCCDLGIVIEKEVEKILKYKDLTIETQRMWKVKTRVIPVIIGATGTISKSFRKYVRNIPRNVPSINIKETTRLLITVSVQMLIW